MPNTTAQNPYQNDDSTEKPTVPPSIIATIPKTRWCTWTPLSETTLPGHHGTFGLRISRVERRMKPNDARNAEEHQEQVLALALLEVVPEILEDRGRRGAHRRASIPARPPRGKPGTDASAAARSATQTPNTTWEGRWKLPFTPSRVALAKPTAMKP